MSKVLEISDSAYEAIERAAMSHGQTPSEFLMTQYGGNKNSATGVDVSSANPSTLADRLRTKVGKFSSHDGGNWAAESSERFAAGMVEKHRAGHF